jgi:hypothetical protein
MNLIFYFSERIKTPAVNERFCKIAALHRVESFCVFSRLVARVESAWKPQPRKAASPLGDTRGQCSGNLKG